MSFIETAGTFESFGTHVITNGRGSRIEIIPGMGARLNSFKVSVNGSLLDVIDGYTSPNELATEYYSKSSLLAPFPNRIADGRYMFEGKEYQLSINKPDEHNAIHGFVSDKAFSVVRSDECPEGYELVLQYQSDGVEGFPFPFEITVTYLFTDDDRLNIKTEVKNTGDASIPIGFGWHPYFTTGADVGNLTLKLPPVKQLEADSRLIPTGAMAEVNDWAVPEKIADAVFDTGFEFISENREVVLSDDYLTITISCGEGYNYLQVFTPPWRTSIAIEPMTCAANAFNNKLGPRILQPGSGFSAEFEISVLTR